jgi:hypothetical protein
MNSALGVVVPLGLAAAVSPVMLAEQTVLVAGPAGRRAGTWYAAGTVLVLAALCAAVEVLGRSVSLPRAPHLDAGLDLVLGAVLLLMAVVVARGGRRTRRAPRSGAGPGPGPAEAFGFGVFSMGTDLTTLAIVLVAARDVAASRSPVIEQLFAILVLIGLATSPAWAPLAAAAAPGGAGQAALTAIGRFMDRHGRTAVVGILVAVGALLVGRGLLRFAGVFGWG